MKKYFLTLSMLMFFFQYGQNQSFTEANGRLKIIGHQLCNQQGNPIQLKGMSTFGIMYYPECITYEGFKTLKEEWGSTVIRTVVFVPDNNNERFKSYNGEPEYTKAIIDSTVKWSKQLGMYCIIDWHVLVPGNPNDAVYSGAIKFWDEMSAKYKNEKHVLYEICNEPNGKGITWDSVCKYSNPVINTIRKNDPNTVIIVGTPVWSQMLQDVDTNKLEQPQNLMYAFHFYSSTHKGLYDEFVKQIHRIPVFATEWGISEANGNGKIDTEIADKFVDAMQMHVLGNDTVRISWCNFSYADKDEACASLKPGSCKGGLWNNVTTDGIYVRKRIKEPCCK